MVPDAIIGALTGNTLEGRDAGGVYAIYYLTAPEGTQKGEMKIYYFGTNSVRSDTGNWWINDSGEYCRQWQQLASSVKCVAFMRSGDEILWVQGNEVTDVSRLVPGNPGKL